MKYKLLDMWESHKKACIIGGVIIVVILAMMIIPRVTKAVNDSKKPSIEELYQKNKENASQGDKVSFKGTNTYLWEQQGRYVKRWGEAGDGFIWNSDGSKLALGDKELSPEDVIYKYLQSLSKLDIENAQKFSRKTQTVKRFKSLYERNTVTSYLDQFDRGIYSESLKSIQIKSVESTSSLSDSKQIYTVRAVILDLTDKDFWVNDTKTVFENLDTFKKDENDDTKADMYLYDYILEYYKRDTAIRRSFTFDITVEKFADIDTGWLVSDDVDLDNACRYKDGKAVVSYIKEKYRDYRNELRYGK